MSRIVSGTLGGRRVAMPAGRGTRPTSDRTREGLFNSLNTLTELEGCRFADLYAGSGAVGIEALSRGAVHALFVESAAKPARVLRENLAALGLMSPAEVVVGSVAKAMASGPGSAPYDVVFADPPYEMPDAELSAVLADAVRGGWVASGGLVVLERSTRAQPPAWVPGLTGVRSRRYGETTLWYGRAS
ncbi:MAG: 16S rRNA (guanine(966)-N(2))-methyltransferase RsmD [Micromonosporaceae bacterium]